MGQTPEARIADLEAQVRDRDARLAAQDARFAALESRLAALEQAGARQPDAAPMETPAPVLIADRGTAPGGEAPARTLSEGDIPPVTVPLGPVGRGLQKSGLAFDLTAASTSSRVSIGLTSDWSRGDLDPRNQQTNSKGETWVSTWRTSVAVSAPLNKSDTRTDVATIDGFASDFEFKAGVSRYWRRLEDPGDQARAAAIEARAITSCQTRVSEALARALRDAADAADRKAAEEAAKKAHAACANADMTSTFVRTYLGKAAETDYLDIRLPDGAFAVGVEGQIGYREYEFVSSTTGLPGDDEDVPWGVSAYYSYLPTSKSSLTGTVKYVSDMKAGKDGVVCPIGGGGPVVCAKGALDAPKDREKLLASVEWRQIIPLGEGWLIPKIGYSALAVYDERSGEYGVDIPIYFVADDKSGLTAGLRLGWESENHDVVLGLFVTSALSVRP